MKLSEIIAMVEEWLEQHTCATRFTKLKQAKHVGRFASMNMVLVVQ